MSLLPFLLIAGDALHRMGGSEVAVRLLTAARQPATRAEIIVASLRAHGSSVVYFQDGNGAFDLYEVGDAVRGIDVKNRSSKFANDLEGWNNTVNQIDEAARAGVALEPWIEQIVTDESGRRTWLLFPGIIPQSRAFAARAKQAADHATQASACATEATARAERETARAERETARANILTKLARELDVAVKAGDLEAVRRISAAMNSVPCPSDGTPPQLFGDP